MTSQVRADERTGLVARGDRLFLLPTLHQTLEFAVLVRRAFFQVRPTVVALELPATVEDAFRRAVLRLPFLSVLLYEDRTAPRGTNDSEDEAPHQEGPAVVYLPVEPHEPMVEAARLALENGVALSFVDRDDGSYPLRRERAPDAYALTRVGPGPYVDALLGAHPPSTGSADQLRDRTMAFHLDALLAGGERILWVGGVAHVRGILEALDEPLAQPFARVRREGVRLFSLEKESTREVMSEIPYVAASYERARSSGGAFDFDGATDTQRVLDRLLVEAAERYRKERREELPPRVFDVIRTFSRNLALIQEVLTPSFYELIVAARGAVDDDFAWFVWDLGSTWPFPDTSRSLPEIALKGADLFLNGRKVRFARRFPGKGARFRKLPLRSRPREKKPGDWKNVKFGGGICSYPPEDVIVEAFGNHLRDKARRRLAEDTRRVYPMTTSLMDGLDVRESVRRHHEGRLFVFEERRLRGGIGSVVVIFDEDETPYSWKTTWLGEHGQESDMAFYATKLGGELDGPGISRCEYGGFLMTFPPGRLADVWSDPDYQGATASESLLLAGVDYALEPHVVYAAKKPPRAAVRRWAARLGKKIVYVPLGSLSSVTAKKLRRFHVLANRGVREYAKGYIF